MNVVFRGMPVKASSPLMSSDALSGRPVQWKNAHACRDTTTPIVWFQSAANAIGQRLRMRPGNPNQDSGRIGRRTVTLTIDTGTVDAGACKHASHNDVCRRRIGLTDTTELKVPSHFLAQHGISSLWIDFVLPWKLWWLLVWNLRSIHCVSDQVDKERTINKIDSFSYVRGSLTHTSFAATLDGTCLWAGHNTGRELNCWFDEFVDRYLF